MLSDVVIGSSLADGSISALARHRRRLYIGSSSASPTGVSSVRAWTCRYSFGTVSTESFPMVPWRGLQQASVHMSVCMSQHMSVRMSAHMSVRMSIRLSVRMSVRMSKHMSVCMSKHMSVRMCCTHVCMHVCAHV